MADILKHINVLVPRSAENGGPSVALVAAAISADPAYVTPKADSDADLVFRNLRSAVAVWLNYTLPRLKSLPQGSVRDIPADFNIADAMEHCSYGPLITDAAPYMLDYWLRLHGFRELRIDAFDDTSSHGWEFDDVLYTRDALSPKTYAMLHGGENRD